MLEIPISYLQPGQISDQNYLSENGDILIPKGTQITPQILNNLSLKGFVNFYVESTEQDEELVDLLFSGTEEGAPVVTAAPLTTITELNSKIQPGKEGFVALMKREIKAQIEALINAENKLDKPTGPAYKDHATRMKAADRTPEYKKTITTTYLDALAKTKKLLSALAGGQSVSSESIRHIASQFLKLFLTDRDILLNLVTIKSEDVDYLYHHSLNVCILSINIAAAYGYNEQQVTEIAMGALLHDAGMMLIPEQIRKKPTRLSEDDWYEIQKHPLLGLFMLEKIPCLPESVALIAYQTHERENGKGYPKQRSSRLIHNYAKIVAIADIFEALSSPRKHREAFLPYKAMETIIKMTKQGLLSGEFVKAFLEYSSLFPIGSIVELSNYCLGRVVKANGTSFAKPVVCILTDDKGNALTSKQQYIEDLSVNTVIQIVKVHQSNLLTIDTMTGF